MSVPVSRAVQLPTFVTGRFRTLEDADAVIAAGDADMVGMTRAHIADPDIVRKTLAGKAHEVRPCIGCNQGCIGGLNQGRMGCTVNVAAGQELHLDEDLITSTESPKKVLVIGGGPSGMEAARVAALRGHHVTLVDASDKLGGTTRVARLAPKHSSIGDIADWLEAELDRQGIDVRLNSFADEALVDELAPDAVILATGASPRMDGKVGAAGNAAVPGVDQDHVVSTQQLLTGRHNQIGGTAVVLDDVGAYEAIGAAEFLVEQGAHVTFVTTQPVFAPRMQGALVSTPALERLQASGRFTLMTRAHVTRIAEKSVEIGSLDNWPAQTVAAETVVLVTLNRPNTDLQSVLEAKGIPVSVVGDATGPEFLPAAIRKGHLAARYL